MGSIDSSLLSSLLPRAREILASCSVVISRAPVLAAPDSFLASVQIRSKEITVNGLALDRELNPSEAQSRWIAHEIFHLLCAENSELVSMAGVYEEVYADQFAEAVWAKL